MKYNMQNSSFKNISKLIKHNPLLFEVHTVDGGVYRLKIREEINQGRIIYSAGCEKLDRKNDQWLQVLIPKEESGNEQECLVRALSWIDHGG
ncbi:MAG TPA: hypothetical protein GXZ36_08945 [Firmicutes bacterium]|nr:hypothetical protein [Bacillota bacterium]